MRIAWLRAEVAMSGSTMMIPEDQALAGSKRGRDDADAISRFSHTRTRTHTHNRSAVHSSLEVSRYNKVVLV